MANHKATIRSIAFDRKERPIRASICTKFGVVFVAGLLSLLDALDDTIQPLHVHNALEIYRWLVASTLGAVEQSEDLRPGSLRQERCHVEAKLAAYGAMSVRQLASEPPKQEPGKIQVILRSLMEERLVSCDKESLYSLVSTNTPSETSQAVVTV